MFVRRSSTSKKTHVPPASVLTILCCTFLLVLDIEYVTSMSLDKLLQERNEIGQEYPQIMEYPIKSESALASNAQETDTYVLLPVRGNDFDRNTIEQNDMEAAQNAGDMLMMETNEAPAATVVQLPNVEDAEKDNVPVNNVLVENVSLLETQEKKLAEGAAQNLETVEKIIKTTTPIALLLADLAQQQAAQPAHEVDVQHSHSVKEIERTAEVSETLPNSSSFAAAEAEEERKDDDSESVADMFLDAVEDIEKALQNENEVAAGVVEDALNEGIREKIAEEVAEQSSNQATNMLTDTIQDEVAEEIAEQANKQATNMLNNAVQEQNQNQATDLLTNVVKEEASNMLNDAIQDEIAKVDVEQNNKQDDDALEDAIVEAVADQSIDSNEGLLQEFVKENEDSDEEDEVMEAVIENVIESVNDAFEDQEVGESEIVSVTEIAPAHLVTENFLPENLPEQFVAENILEDKDPLKVNAGVEPLVAEVQKTVEENSIVGIAEQQNVQSDENEMVPDKVEEEELAENDENQIDTQAVEEEKEAQLAVEEETIALQQQLIADEAQEDNQEATENPNVNFDEVNEEPRQPDVVLQEDQTMEGVVQDEGKKTEEEQTKLEQDTNMEEQDEEAADFTDKPEEQLTKEVEKNLEGQKEEENKVQELKEEQHQAEQQNFNVRNDEENKEEELKTEENAEQTEEELMDKQQETNDPKDDVPKEVELEQGTKKEDLAEEIQSQSPEEQLSEAFKIEEEEKVENIPNGKEEEQKFNEQIVEEATKTEEQVTELPMEEDQQQQHDEEEQKLEEQYLEEQTAQKTTEDEQKTEQSQVELNMKEEVKLEESLVEKPKEEENLKADEMKQAEQDLANPTAEEQHAEEQQKGESTFIIEAVKKEEQINANNEAEANQITDAVQPLTENDELPESVQQIEMQDENPLSESHSFVTEAATQVETEQAQQITEEHNEPSSDATAVQSLEENMQAAVQQVPTKFEDEVQVDTEMAAQVEEQEATKPEEVAVAIAQETATSTLVQYVDDVAEKDTDKAQNAAAPLTTELNSILTTIVPVPPHQPIAQPIMVVNPELPMSAETVAIAATSAEQPMQILENQFQPAQEPQQQVATTGAMNVMDSVLNYVNASFINNNKKPQQPVDDDDNLNSKLRRYDGAQVWRIVVQNDKDKKMADELQTKYDGQLWKEVKSEVDYLLKPQVLADAEKHIRRANLSRIVLIDNLQKVIEVENPPASEIAQLQNRKGHRMTWQAYHRLADIHGFFDYLGKTYPDICSVETIGYSIEKRALKILKISNGNAGNPGVWIDGGMHAREWISPASVTFIANQIVEGWEDLPEYMRNVNWYIHAVANPDGYEYSHTTDRLWRKNMRSHGRQCPGVDLNRNFGYKWGGKGTSANPCSQTYRGSNAFSEPETFYISKFISNFPRETFQAYLSFHSYGQYILYPWGYDYLLSADRADLDLVARQAGTIITKSSGVKYTVGSSATTLYPAAGGSDDWAKGIAGIKYSYTIEMGDTGRYGFVLPASMIENNGKDAFTFVETVARAVTHSDKESRKRAI